MSEEPLSFEEHRRRRDENASAVQRVKCRKWIVATATRCPECGIHFLGEAQEFSFPSGPDSGTGSRTWLVVLAAVLSLVRWTPFVGRAWGGF